MPMEEALVARLAGTAAIAAIAGDRISWFGRARGDGFPAVLLAKISVGEEWTHAGPDGLEEPRVQIDSYATDDETVAALGRAVRAEMRDARDVDGVRFHPAALERDDWIDEGEQEGGEPLFRVSQDYVFYHEEI